MKNQNQTVKNESKDSLNYNPCPKTGEQPYVSRLQESAIMENKTAVYLVERNGLFLSRDGKFCLTKSDIEKWTIKSFLQNLYFDNIEKVPMLLSFEEVRFRHECDIEERNRICSPDHDTTYTSEWTPAMSVITNFHDLPANLSGLNK